MYTIHVELHITWRDRLRDKIYPMKFQAWLRNKGVARPAAKRIATCYQFIYSLVL